MQIVIDISEELYKATVNGLVANEIWDLRLAVANGTPLPEGHGRLFDEKELKKEAIRCEWSRIMYDKLDHTLSYMKPIIEADKS